MLLHVYVNILNRKILFDVQKIDIQTDMLNAEYNDEFVQNRAHTHTHQIG